MHHKMSARSPFPRPPHIFDARMTYVVWFIQSPTHERIIPQLVINITIHKKEEAISQN